MALQKRLAKKSVTDNTGFSGQKQTIVLTLKLWNAGDNPDVDPAVLEKDIGVDFTGDISYTKTEAATKAQQIINSYKIEQQIFNSVALDNAIAVIDGALEG